MLIQQIKTDLLAARKARTDKTKIDLLTTLVGEAEMIGKNAGNRETTDEEVVTLVKKFIKNTEFTLEKAPSDVAAQELQILNCYIPKQLSNDQLAEIIKAIPDNSNFGNVMKVLKSNYAGLFDGGNARAVWQSLQ